MLECHPFNLVDAKRNEFIHQVTKVQKSKDTMCDPVSWPTYDDLIFPPTTSRLTQRALSEMSSVQALWSCRGGVYIDLQPLGDKR